RSAEGMLNPIGGYKGSGLALVLGLLAGPLNGGAFGRGGIGFNYDDEHALDTRHVMMALEVARFGPLAAFKAELDRHLRDLSGSRSLPGFGSVRLPGRERLRRRNDRVKNGVPMPRELIVELDKLAGDLGIEPLGSRASINISATSERGEP